MTSSTCPGARAEDDVAQDGRTPRDRAASMEVALETIAREIDHALDHPEIQHLALCRLATIVTRARMACAAPPDDDDEHQSGVRVTPAAGARRA